MRPSSTVLVPPPPRSRYLRLTVDVPGGAIRVAGDLDRASAHHLADALSALRSSPVAVWTLDLDDVSFCDVEGLRVLTGAAGLARSCGCGLRMSRIPRVLAELLAVFAASVEDARPVPCWDASRPGLSAWSGAWAAHV